MVRTTTKRIVMAIRAGTKRRKAKKKRYRYPYGSAGAAATHFCARHGASHTKGEPAEEVIKTNFSLYTLEWGAYYQGFLEGFSAAMKEKR